MTFSRISWTLASILLLLAGVLQARTTGNVSIETILYFLCRIRPRCSLSSSLNRAVSESSKPRCTPESEKLLRSFEGSHSHDPTVWYSGKLKMKIAKVLLLNAWNFEKKTNFKSPFRMLCRSLFVDGFIDHQDLCSSFVSPSLPSLGGLSTWMDGWTSTHAAWEAIQMRSDWLVDCREAWNIVLQLKTWKHTQFANPKLDRFSLWLFDRFCITHSIIHRPSSIWSILFALCVALSGIYDVWRMIDFLSRGN